MNNPAVMARYEHGHFKITVQKIFALDKYLYVTTRWDKRLEDEHNDTEQWMFHSEAEAYACAADLLYKEIEK